MIVLGGGTAGCIVAGRLAEKGINPKTGDRLRVAMIEGGDDWTVRDPAITPGYGQPIRRRIVTNIDDGIGPDGRGGPSFVWPGAMGEGPGAANFKSVGGGSLHWGGQAWIPGDEDFHFYREASGVDWDQAKLGAAIQEARDLLHVQALPDNLYSPAHRIWANAGKQLGFEMRNAENCYLNPLGTEHRNIRRYDTKATALPWAYIGLNNGLRIIPNAEIEKVLIERPAGGRPVAVGAVYKDKQGRMHEVRPAEQPGSVVRDDAAAVGRTDRAGPIGRPSAGAWRRAAYLCTTVRLGAQGIHAELLRRPSLHRLAHAFRCHPGDLAGAPGIPVARRAHG